MSIWKNPVNLERVNSFNGGETLVTALGIRFTDAGDDFLEATMAVTERTKQPFGLLHGGASCALAETVGSVASNLVVGRDSGKACVGIELNANHVKAVRDGVVTARAVPLHLGSALHVWDIRITDERKKLVCISRLTVMVRESKEGSSAPRA